MRAGGSRTGWAGQARNGPRRSWRSSSGSAFVIWYTYYAWRKPDPIEEARRADMFARGWTPLDEDVHFPPAWFAKISKLRTVGSEMPHTTWGKDGWITFNYDVMQFISDANPSYGTDIVFLVCPCTVPRGPLMWATIYQGRKMFQHQRAGRRARRRGRTAEDEPVQTESDRDGWTNLHMVAGELHAVAAAFF